MGFRIKEKQLQGLLSSRGDLSHYSINRDWFLGFVEAEGSFIGRGKKPPIFEITQHSSDLTLFHALQRWLGAGTVRVSRRKDGRESVVYTLRGKDNLRKHLIPIPECSLPDTEKFKNSFLPWCDDHFPNVKLGEKESNLSRNWLVGFTDGDGSFYTTIRKQDDYRIRFQFQAVFDLVQRSNLSKEKDGERRSSLLSRIADTHFSEANRALINRVGNDSMDRVRIVSNSCLHRHVIPLFQNKLQTRKEIQFLLFQDAVEFIKNREHLEPRNGEEIMAFKERYKEWQQRHSS